jgi:hypothetical protein
MFPREIFSLITPTRPSSGQGEGILARFEQASEIFLDPLAIWIYDEDHSVDENRWITLGKNRAGKLLVAIHTFLEKSEDVCIIRMISARKATRKEIKQYEGDKP